MKFHMFIYEYTEHLQEQRSKNLIISTQVHVIIYKNFRNKTRALKRKETCILKYGVKDVIALSLNTSIKS